MNVSGDKRRDIVVSLGHVSALCIQATQFLLGSRIVTTQFLCSVWRPGRWRRHERHGVSGSAGGGERGWGHGHITEPERYIGQRKTRGLTECTRPGNIRPTLWRCHDFFYMKSPSARPRRPSQCASTAVTQWSQSNSP